MGIHRQTRLVGGVGGMSYITARFGRHFAQPVKRAAPADTSLAAMLADAAACNARLRKVAAVGEVAGNITSTRATCRQLVLAKLDGVARTAPEIADLTGRSQEAVRRALLILMAAGLARCEKRQRIGYWVASADPAIGDPRALRAIEADDADGLPGGAPDAAGAMALLIALADG